MRKFRAFAWSMPMPSLLHRRIHARAKVQMKKKKLWRSNPSTPPNHSHTMCFAFTSIDTLFILSSRALVCSCGCCVAYYYSVEHLCESTQSNSQPSVSLAPACRPHTNTQTHHYHQQLTRAASQLNKFRANSIMVYFSATFLRTESHMVCVILSNWLKWIDAFANMQIRSWQIQSNEEIWWKKESKSNRYKNNWLRVRFVLFYAFFFHISLHIFS